MIYLVLIIFIYIAVYCAAKAYYWRGLANTYKRGYEDISALNNKCLARIAELQKGAQDD